ncbi:MAG: phage tail protein, partial [Prevotella sp.]|nr:phage tail protein [Prevotella sp.]
MKKAMKWLAILLVTPILLFLLLTLLLYLPPVQNWAVDKVAAYASEQTGMDISVGHVALRFPLDLTADDVRVIKDNDSIPGVRDTIADVGKLYVDIQLKPLFKKQVEIDALGFERLRLNTDGLIPDVRVKGNVEKVDLQCHGVNLKESLANVDHALLDSAKLEICLADTMPPDTTETENNWRIRVADLQLKRTQIDLRMPGDTMQVRGYISEAKAKEGDIDLGQGKYKVGQLDCQIPRLQYDNRFHPATDGLDANHIEVSDMAVRVDSVSYSESGLKLALRSCSFKEKSGLQVDELTAKVAL